MRHTGVLGPAVSAGAHNINAQTIPPIYLSNDGKTRKLL